MTLGCLYSTIRYVHDPVRNEPVNIGVAIWPANNPAGVLIKLESSVKRIEDLYPSVHVKSLKAALSGFRDACRKSPALLTSPYGGYSSIVTNTPSAVICQNMEVELEDLFDILVSPSASDLEEPRERSRNTKYVKAKLREYFRDTGILANVQDEQDLRQAPGKSGVSHTFDYAYRNGQVHRIKAISFDYGLESQKLEKAGALAFAAQDVGAPIDAIIQKPSASGDDDAYTKAFQILSSVPNLECIAVSTDDDLREYCERTKRRIHHQA